MTKRLVRVALKMMSLTLNSTLVRLLMAMQVQLLVLSSHFYHFCMRSKSKIIQVDTRYLRLHCGKSVPATLALPMRCNAFPQQALTKEDHLVDS